MYIKGFFLWTNDPEASLQWWLMAMEEAADSRVNVSESEWIVILTK